MQLRETKYLQIMSINFAQSPCKVKLQILNIDDEFQVATSGEDRELLRVCRVAAMKCCYWLPAESRKSTKIYVIFQLYYEI